MSATSNFTGASKISGTKRDTERHRRAVQDVSDLVALGHGFQIERYGTGVPLLCKFCWNYIWRQPPEVCICEFGEPLQPGCQCNRCLEWRWGLVREGRPPKTCGSDACKKALKAARDREYRKRRKLSKG